MKEVLKKKTNTVVQNTPCPQSCMHRPLALRKTLSTSCASSTDSVLHCTYVLMLCAFSDPFSFMRKFIMCELAVLEYSSSRHPHWVKAYMTTSTTDSYRLCLMYSALNRTYYISYTAQIFQDLFERHVK